MPIFEYRVCSYYNSTTQMTIVKYTNDYSQSTQMSSRQKKIIDDIKKSNQIKHYMLHCSFPQSLNKQSNGTTNN